MPRIRTIGILMYLVGLLVQYTWGSNEIFFWCAVYMLIQNAGMALVCISSMKDTLIYRLVAITGLAYFSSAFCFYAIVILTNDVVYFSQSECAGDVLAWLLAISVSSTLLHAYATRK